MINVKALFLPVVTFLEKDVTLGTCRRIIKDNILIVVDLGVH